jgi:hypothetical protein
MDFIRCFAISILFGETTRNRLVLPSEWAVSIAKRHPTMTHVNAGHKSRSSGKLPLFKAALLALPLTLAISHQHARAQAMPAGPACAAALRSLTAEWNAIGFHTPDKPGQLIVSSQHGYTMTGGQYRFLVGQIQAGARDCEAGREAASLDHINAVRSVLATPVKPGSEFATR